MHLKLKKRDLHLIEEIAYLLLPMHDKLDTQYLDYINSKKGQKQPFTIQFPYNIDTLVTQVKEVNEVQVQSLLKNIISF